MLKSLFNWKVLLNLVVALAIFTGLVWLTFRWLEYRTNHGKEIPVPNVMNMTVHQAIKILEDSGLEAEVDSFKYDPKYKPFQVLQIYPSAGSRVKDGRTIVLKVNPRTWAKVAVPDVLDRYKYLAFRQLDLVGLKIGDTIYEPNIQKDAVIRMMYNGTTLKPGTLLSKFSTIDLVIGSGPLRNVSVPNLVGMTVQEAKTIIKTNHFEVGMVEHEDGGKDESDVVYYQDPERGSLRDQGMQIDLWASKKTPAELRAKIAALDKIYRVNVTPPPAESVDQGAYNVPEYEPAPATPKVEESPAPKSKTSETKTTEEKKPTPKATTEQKTKATIPTGDKTEI